MATQTYKVKKGDTLSGIANSLGVGMDQISGYRSGNKDRIYEGEDLTIGPSYTEEVKSQLGSESETPETTGTATEKPQDLYDASKIREDISLYKTKMDDAFNRSKTARSEKFNSEYEGRKLAEKKDKISLLDTTIADKKKARDAYIASVKGRSDISDAAMTGKIRKATQTLNDEINNLIGERNAVAGEYNSELGEIKSIADIASGEADKEYKYFADLLGRSDTELSNYQKVLKDALSEDRDQSNWEKDFAQKLQIAQLKAEDSGKGSSKLKLWRNSLTGQPEFWYDDFGNTYPYEEAKDGEPGGSQAQTEVEADNSDSKGWLKSIRDWFAGLGN